MPCLAVYGVEDGVADEEWVEEEAGTDTRKTGNPTFHSFTTAKANDTSHAPPANQPDI